MRLTIVDYNKLQYYQLRVGFACSEYGSQYRIAYQTGCESNSTEESCELIIEGEEWYMS